MLKSSALQILVKFIFGLAERNGLILKVMFPDREAFADGLQDVGRQ